jgi:hypothetical protein
VFVGWEESSLAVLLWELAGGAGHRGNLYLLG